MTNYATLGYQPDMIWSEIPEKSEEKFSSNYTSLKTKSGSLSAGTAHRTGGRTFELSWRNASKDTRDRIDMMYQTSRGGVYPIAYIPFPWNGSAESAALGHTELPSAGSARTNGWDAPDIDADLNISNRPLVPSNTEETYANLGAWDIYTGTGNSIVTANDTTGIAKFRRRADTDCVLMQKGCLIPGHIYKLVYQVYTAGNAGTATLGLEVQGRTWRASTSALASFSHDYSDYSFPERWQNPLNIKGVSFLDGTPYASGHSRYSSHGTAKEVYSFKLDTTTTGEKFVYFVAPTHTSATFVEETSSGIDTASRIHPGTFGIKAYKVSGSYGANDEEVALSQISLYPIGTMVHFKKYSRTRKSGNSWRIKVTLVESTKHYLPDRYEA
tara:strand:+ start:91 stop:1245 length:1155 start_codon:yes stop_codon:yes gene_type:complete